MLKFLRQLATESLVYGLATTMTRLITIFLVPLYTRALTPADYGIMSLVRNTATLLAVLASLSLDSAAQRFYWDTKVLADRKTTLACWAWSWLAVGTLGAVLLFILADDLTLKMIGTKEPATSLRLAASAVP